MTLVRPTLSALIDRARSDIETRLPGADSRLRHSVLDVLARMHAGAVAGLYGYLDNLAEQLFEDTATGDYLARRAAVRGLRKKAAVASVLTATATGTPGAPIDAATGLTRTDGAVYRTTTAATIDGGSATIRVEAVDAGPGGDLPAGAVLTFATPVAGVDAIATVTGTVVAGADEEEDEALRARLLARIRTTPQGGALADYEAWAKEQPGVTRAWAFAAWLGAGTVGLTFVMDGRADPIPTDDDVLAVQTALDVLRPVTADLTVFAPATQSVNFSIAASPASTAVRSAIVAELQDFFRRESAPGGTLYLSRMREAISLASGEDHHNLTAPSANVTAGPGVLPVLGTVTFT